MMNSEEILEREFLELRSKLLDIAASFDRLDRADGTVGENPKVRLLKQGLTVLSSDAPDRAHQIQQLFSRDFDPQWKDKFNLPDVSS